jgi:hypothetical protein
MKYPLDWTKTETANSVVLTSKDERLDIFYHHNIPLFATAVETLEKNAQKAIDYQKTNNLQIKDSKDITVSGGLPAKRVVYTYTTTTTTTTQDVDKYSVMAIIVVNKNDLYKIFFTAKSNQFDSQLPIAEKIIDSIRFTESAGNIPGTSTTTTTATTTPPSPALLPSSSSLQSGTKNDTFLLLSDNFDSENNRSGMFNYQSFMNWTVKDGTVDLIGNGFYDVAARSNGLYIDLDGSNADAGILESKEEFTLSPGNYVLEFDISGSFRGDTNTVTVRLGNAFAETFTKESDSPFEHVVRAISISQPTAVKLSFDHNGGDNNGIKLDNVKLYKIRN